MKKTLLCITLHSDYQLAQSIADFLHLPLHVPTITTFADSELEVSLWQEFLWSEREVLIIVPTVYRVHDELIKTLFLVDTLKQRGVKKIFLLLSYCGYARQCKDTTGQFKGHMNVVARMIEVAGVDVLIIIEPHENLASFFSIPVHEILVHHSIASAIETRFTRSKEMCLVAPDEGSLERVKHIAHELQLPFMYAVKQRFATDQTRVMGIHGYKGYSRALIIDDIIDTGSTALSVARCLQNLGVEETHGYFVHGVFSHGVKNFLNENLYTTVSISPTVQLADEDYYDRVKTFAIHHTYKEIYALLHSR